VRESVSNLKWSTSNAELISLFTIERSIDGENFTPVENITAKNLDSQVIHYSIQDDLEKILFPVIYYRIRITGNNGLVVYSNIERVTNSSFENETLRIIPNPYTQFSKIYFQSDKSENAQVRVVDMLGRTQLVFTSDLRKGYNMIGLERLSGLVKGIYLVQLVNKNSLVLGSQKILVQ
jgi:hypothetical protein